MTMTSEDTNTTPLLLPALSVLLLLSSCYFVFQHAKRQTSFLVILLSILSFGFGFAAVALLPIDLSYASVALMTTTNSSSSTSSSANNDNAEDNNNDNDGNDYNTSNPTYLPWRITYWTTFSLAWFVLPIAREVLTSGQFTLYHRFMEGLSNAVRGLLLMIVFGILSIIAMAIHLKSFHLVTIVLPVLMAMGNTYGLLLVALLLGNGLVNIPKRYWREACPSKELRRALIMTTNAEEELFEAVMQLEDVEEKIDEVCQTTVCLRHDDDDDASGAIVEDVRGKFQRHKRGRRGFCICKVDEVTEFHECLEELVRRKNVTADLCSERRSRRAGNASGSPTRRRNGGGRSNVYDENDIDRNGDAELNTMDIKYLVSLNGLLTTAQERVTSAQLRCGYLMEHSRLLTKLMDDDASLTRREFEYDTDTDALIASSSGPKRCCRKLRFTLQRTWVRYLRFPVYRSIALVTATLSVFVLLSEVTLGMPINLSPFSWTLHALDRYHRKNDNSTSRVLFQLVALIPLLYMSLCVYSCLAQISQLGPYCMRSNRQSTGVALLFNAQYLVRLQFPLGYNYLLMLKYDMTHCAFNKIMSDMSTIPFFGTSFTVYAPLVILAVCIFTLCDFYQMILRFIGIEHEDSLLLGEEDELESKVNEGIQLMKRDAERRGNDSRVVGGSISASPEKQSLNGHRNLIV